MPRIIRNTLLNYIPREFEIEKTINPLRVFDVNNKSKIGKTIVYLCEREIRIKDNFALQFAMEKSNELALPLKIIHPQVVYEREPKQIFINQQILQAQKMFKKANIDFEIIPSDKILEFINKLNPAILIVDFNPIINRGWMKDLTCKIYEIDGHNIIPARFISDMQEYSASTLRSKIYRNIYSFLTEFENITEEKNEAEHILEDFIKNKLPFYAEFRNHPDKNLTSGLSKYLNLGFVSSQRVAIEVIKSEVSDENKEAFLEELIIRKELSDNFCLYAKSFKNFSSIPSWATLSLKNHELDLRHYVFNLSDLERAETHDDLWNATQKQLKKEGFIQSYLRMYWAKKILEWSLSPEVALKNAIYLNDKYAYDAPSSNGYVGILWAIGGLHDRAFVDFPITGKIRRMTYDSIKRKYDLSGYINKYLI